MNSIKLVSFYFAPKQNRSIISLPTFCIYNICYLVIVHVLYRTSSPVNFWLNKKHKLVNIISFHTSITAYRNKYTTAYSTCMLILCIIHTVCQTYIFNDTFEQIQENGKINLLKQIGESI